MREQRDDKTTGSRFASLFLEVDPRSLGLVRILLAILLLADLGRHVAGASDWFLETGVLPRDAALRLSSTTPLSFFLLLTNAPAAALGFALCAVVYVGLLAGFRTKRWQLLSLVAAVGLHTRAEVLEHSGERSLHLLMLYSLFLPLGARFSIDAGRALPRGESPVDRRFASVAVAALIVQLALLYLFDTLAKSGPSWKDLSAVHHAITPCTGTFFGVAAKELLPLGAFQALSALTLAIEMSLPALLLLPFRSARTAAVVAMVLLHAGIASMMNLGVFQPSMILLALLLLPGTAWDTLGRSPTLARWTQRIRGVGARAAEVLTGGSRMRLAFEERLARRFPGPAHWAREIAAGAFGLCMGVLLLAENRPVPDALRPNAALTRRVRRVFQRVGVFQNWNHYNNPQPEEGILVADAITTDGRHVDPIGEAAWGHEGPPVVELPRRVPISLLWRNFGKYAHSPPRSDALLQPLGAWILRHPERTGKPEDEIASFTVSWLVTRDMEGKRTSTQRALLRYPRSSAAPPASTEAGSDE